MALSPGARSFARVEQSEKLLFECGEAADFVTCASYNRTERGQIRKTFETGPPNFLRVQLNASMAQSEFMTMLSFRNVSKSYLTEEQPVQALRGVSLEVAPGELVGLVGRSGCGKSTLLHLAGAMDFPTSGEVTIDGQTTTGLNDAQQTAIRRKKVGFVFQSFQLIHTLTVLENVELPLLLAGKDDARRQALQRSQSVELSGLEDRYPHQLSGGQMQRVAIARALVHSPKILLADEPTGNLDTTTGSVILQLILRLTREQQTATVIATHSAEAAGICDAVVRLRDGQIEEIIRR
jgi:putative ABC transport system ATP-binding protein